MDLSPEQKIAGILTPLFALRGKEDLGIGDVAALREFVDWAAEHGFQMVQLLPINETGNDHSPYNAISSIAIDPATIETSPQAMPDLLESDIRETLKGFDMDAIRTGPVHYKEVKALKRSLLRCAFARFMQTEWEKNTERARQFLQFTKDEREWMDGYALFRVLMEQNEAGEQWDLWPEEQRTAALAREWVAAQSAKVQRQFANDLRFVKYIQWVAFDQWLAVKKYAESRGVALMGDVPFGVSYYSADVFSSPELFDHTWSGGAPPEPLFKDDPFTVKWGQNWGVPLYRWNVLKARDLDWWRQRVKKVREIFHLFRIDHILGFFRIYGFPWRPQRNQEFLPMTQEEAQERTGGQLPHFHEHDDETLANRELNRLNGEDRLRPLLEETGDFRLIGEDLGTVPDYVRPSLTSLKIAGFKVPQWETDSNNDLVRGGDYPRLSVATYATHDHDPLAVQWGKWMSLIERAEHDPGEDAAHARDNAWYEMRRIAEWAGLEVPRIAPFSNDVHEQFLLGLFESNAWIAILMITDLFATGQRFNVPGAVAASNWSERLEDGPAEWMNNDALNEKMNRIRAMLLKSGRA